MMFMFRRGDHFDLFVLSDTRDADIQRREVIAFEKLRNAMPQARLYYRLNTVCVDLNVTA